ncbi:MAG TPA: hypothetical protein VLT36_11690 [Candidatus Dormibacteraeota bacterium]|nr:hypothetical protein [Candidatus Dormibacteraeota bacterium]
MKTYVLTTGVLFAAMTLIHIWRVVSEWPHQFPGAGFVVGMAALILIPGGLCWWAWRVLRGLPRT